MIVVLRCIGSAEIGGGHVDRCIGLVEALAADGHQPLFAVSHRTVNKAPSLFAPGDIFAHASRPVAATART
jgi:spore coat polysaccharide biosynthesis predicted glycosyltransferase SpsG